jgi:hypothetical protein
MHEELENLDRNQVWILVESPKDVNVKNQVVSFLV